MDSDGEQGAREVATFVAMSAYRPRRKSLRYKHMDHLQDVLTASLEAGMSTLLFDSASTGLLEEWKQIGRFTVLSVSDSGDIFEASTKVCTICRKLVSWYVPLLATCKGSSADVVACYTCVHQRHLRCEIC